LSGTKLNGSFCERCVTSGHENAVVPVPSPHFNNPETEPLLSESFAYCQLANERSRHLGILWKFLDDLFGYTVRFQDAIYVLYVFQKKSTKAIATPTREIELIKQRLAEAERDWQN